MEKPLLTLMAVFKIRGIKGLYQNITPHKLGVGDMWNEVSVASVISSLKSK